MKKRILILTSTAKKDQAAFEKDKRTKVLSNDANAVVCFCHEPKSSKDIVQKAKECRATHIVCDGVSIEMGNNTIKLLNKTWAGKHKLLTMTGGIEGAVKITSYDDIFVEEPVRSGVEEEAMAAA
ncbi:MAG: hypothetical protein JWL92_614 [Candidatus Nomurabacteria bacterium]|nr:hypothetical protein [Candidatus Nomurabacteria bacterium]